MLKKPVREIMSRNIIAAHPDQLLAEAVQTMREKNVSCMPVLEDKRPVGVFTERHLVRHIARKGLSFSSVPVRELMSSPVLTVNQDMYLYEALHVLESNRIRHLVVVDDKGMAVGVVTLSSIMEHVGEDLSVELQPVERLMSKVLFTVDRDLPVRDVLLDMSERSISCVIHVEDNRPIGIVTERDIVSIALKNGDLGTVMLSEVMSKPVVTVRKFAYIHEVATIMRAQGIRRVVVVDDNGRVAGLATQSNIVHGFESGYVRVLKQVIEDKDGKLEEADRQREELAMIVESILRSSLDMGIVATDTDQRIIYFNECASSLLGWKASEALGKNVTELHKSIGVEKKRLQGALDHVAEGHHHNFVYRRAVDGENRYYQARIASIRGCRGDFMGYVHMVKDITEEKKAEENIRFMAYHDMLTGLPNRVSFEERFGLELSRAERKGHRIAVVVADLNRFKYVNDTLGHFVGDLMLQNLAERLKSCLRKSDTVARIGGDEFALILPEIKDENDVAGIMAKIEQAMQEPFELKGERLDATLSIGISIYPEHATAPNRLMELADQAMFTAKKQAHRENATRYAFTPANGAV